jgi:hypothetical protein
MGSRGPSHLILLQQEKEEGHMKMHVRVDDGDSCYERSFTTDDPIEAKQLVVEITNELQKRFGAKDAKPAPARIKKPVTATTGAGAGS